MRGEGGGQGGRGQEDKKEREKLSNCNNDEMVDHVGLGAVVDVHVVVSACMRALVLFCFVLI